MADFNTVFCRAQLSMLVAELGISHPEIRVQRHAWVYNFRDGCWEMQGNTDGPAAGFYWYGKADNAYDARYKGWSKWVEDKEAQAQYKRWLAQQQRKKTRGIA